VWKRFGDTTWMPGSLMASGLMVMGWAYFIWTGNINTIWPMFGVANQLLASVALAVATTIIINSGRAKYSFVTFVPLCFLSVSTLYGGFLNIRDNYWPLAVGPNPAVHTQGYVDSICTAIMLVCSVVILSAAARRWVLVLTGRVPALELAEA
jgi:carbon starvation protein